MICGHNDVLVISAMLTSEFNFQVGFPIVYSKLVTIALESTAYSLVHGRVCQTYTNERTATGGRAEA